MAIKTALEHYRLTFKEHLIANAILLLSTFYFAKATSYLFPTGFDYKSDLNILHMYIQFPPPPGQEMFHKDCIFLTLYTYDHYFPLFRFFYSQMYFIFWLHSSDSYTFVDFHTFVLFPRPIVLPLSSHLKTPINE